MTLLLMRCLIKWVQCWLNAWQNVQQVPLQLLDGIIFCRRACTTWRQGRTCRFKYYWRKLWLNWISLRNPPGNIRFSFYLLFETFNKFVRRCTGLSHFHQPKSFFSWAWKYQIQLEVPSNFTEYNTPTCSSTSYPHK